MLGVATERVLSLSELHATSGLATYRFGDGRPLFLMPGPHRFQRPGMRSADALIDGLVRLGRAVITYDPPGSGRSTRRARLSMAEMHECAVEALEVSGCDGPVDAIGHSMGGLALLAFALDQPDRVRRLVLVGTGSGGRALMAAPGGLHRPGHPAFARMALLGMLQLVWPFRAPEQMVLDLVERASFVDRRHVRPRRISPGDWLRRREGRADWHWIARRTDYAPRLAEIRAPTLVLVGRHDPQFPVACSDELHARIVDSRLTVLERSGHYPFIEEPHAFWTAVDDFLAAGEATR